MRVRPILEHWLPVVAWIAMILLLGSRDFSSAKTGDEIAALLPFLSQAQVDLVNAIIRKSAHLTEYALLGWVTYRATTAGKAGWNTRAAVVAVLVAVAVASTDEFHQSFVGNRTATPWDVCIDGIGALVGQLGWRRR